MAWDDMLGWWNCVLAFEPLVSLLTVTRGQSSGKTLVHLGPGGGGNLGGYKIISKIEN